MDIRKVFGLTALAAAAGLVVVTAAPAASDSRSVREPESKGRDIYVAQCAVCHGDAGKGNGRAAVDMSVQPADLTDPDVSGTSERKLLRKLLRSPKPMPNFEQLLTENERVEVVKYVRSLSRTVADGE